MPNILTVQTDLTPQQLAQLVRKQANPRVRQRLLAVRLVVMGKTVPQAAHSIGLKQRQTRTWIHRFNKYGLKGLYDQQRPGQPPKLPHKQQQAFRHRIQESVKPSDGVCSLRGKDIQRILQKEFDAYYSLGGVYFLLHRLGFSCLVPRPSHPKADKELQEHFKKRYWSNG